MAWNGLVDKACCVLRIAYCVLCHPPLATRHPLLRLLVISLLTPFLLSCTAVRPVVKIGLIAPFEGLYRRTGYDALHAMRAAINEADAGQIDLLPLALDDSRDPQRTLHKLWQDRQVRALIGPIMPATVASLAAQTEPSSLLWLAPGRLTTAGFVAPDDQHTALNALIAAIIPIMRQQGAQRLVLAGWPNAVPPPASTSSVMPSVVVTQVDEVQVQDAVFWLGNAAEAADFLTRLRQVQPTVPFWLGLQGEDPVFAALTPMRTQVYWASWADPAYDQWAQSHTPSSLLAYQVYVATQQAIARLVEPTAEPQRVWSVRFFALLPDGSSQPLLDSRNHQ